MEWVHCQGKQICQKCFLALLKKGSTLKEKHLLPQEAHYFIFKSWCVEKQTGNHKRYPCSPSSHPCKCCKKQTNKQTNKNKKKNKKLPIVSSPLNSIPTQKAHNVETTSIQRVPAGKNIIKSHSCTIQSLIPISPGVINNSHLFQNKHTVYTYKLRFKTKYKI